MKKQELIRYLNRFDDTAEFEVVFWGPVMEWVSSTPSLVVAYTSVVSSFDAVFSVTGEMYGR